MTDDLGPFAPIDQSEAADAIATPNSDIDESTVVTPVPDARLVGDAAIRLIGGRKPTTYWRYHNANRETLFAVVRWDAPDGKEFRPMCWVRQPDGREDWAFKAHPAPRPLYRLHSLSKSRGGPVVIVEGEKCADAAGGVFPDLVVTTSPGGAMAAAQADWTPLAEAKEVLIWPDADEPGKTYAEKVALALHQLGVATIHIIDAVALAKRTPDGGTREPPPGWDVADAIEEGWTAEALRKAAEDRREDAGHLRRRKLNGPTNSR